MHIYLKEKEFVSPCVMVNITLHITMITHTYRHAAYIYIYTDDSDTQFKKRMDYIYPCIHTNITFLANLVLNIV